MRIGIDCRLAVEPQPRGTGRYIERLVEHLTDVDTSNDYVFYVHRTENHERLPRTPRTRVKVIPFQFYPVWEQVLLPVHARFDKLDLLHCPATTGPLFLPRGLTLVATVHDISFLLPEDVMPRPRAPYQRLGWMYRRWVVPRSARRAARVITVSNHTRGEIVQELGISQSKTRVIYHGLTLDQAREPTDEVLLPEGLPERYVLCVGGKAPHKNTARAIRAFASIVASGRSQGHHMVVLGAQASDISAGARSLMPRSCDDYIHFVAFASDPYELSALYRHAVVMLNPSINESFGLPALEAMASGVPVITSNVAAIPEIVDDAALLVDPLSETSIEDAIVKMLGSAVLRQEYIQKGYARSRQFSWGRAASETLTVYRESVSQRL